MIANGIDTITVRGFKSIAAIEGLKLRPINVLIGANGSGKSNFLGVFELLRAVRNELLGAYVTAGGGAEKMLHFGSKTTRTMFVQILFANYDEYQLALSPTNSDNLIQLSEKSILTSTINNEIAEGEDTSDSWMRERLHSFRMYHVHDTSFSSLMRKTANVDDNHELRADGANLAAFYTFCKKCTLILIS